MHLPYQTDHCGSRGSDSLPSRSAGGERRASLASPALLGKQHQITTPPPGDKAAQLRRLERFELHATVRKVLSSSYTKDRKGTPQERKVVKCLHTPRAKFVEVWKSAKNGLHYYGGLVVCGDVWGCPLCAPRWITAPRSRWPAAAKPIPAA